MCFVGKEEFDEILGNESIRLEKTIQMFPVFTQNGRCVFKYSASLFSHNDHLKDWHKWSNDKKNHDKVRPLYDEMTIEEISWKRIRCTAVDHQNLFKTVLVSEQFVYVAYCCESEYCAPSQPKQMRLSQGDSVIIKDALIGRSIYEAHKFLVGKGYGFSHLQVKNQARNVKNVVKKQCNQNYTTRPSKLADFAATHPNCHYENSSSDEWVFMQAYGDNIGTFASLCPKVDDVMLHKKNIEKLCSLNKSKAAEEVAKIVESEQEGYKYLSGLHIDTTFGLTDALVTLICGQLPVFRTKSSHKGRILLLAVMLTPKKNAIFHEKFANFFANSFKEEANDRRIPYVMSDGESALKVYAKKLETQQLLCTVHLLDNLKHSTKSSSAEFVKAKTALFGKTNNDNVLSSCILSSLSFESFEKKIAAVKGRVLEGFVKWIEKRSSDLWNYASLTARLNAGVYVQFPSNNSLENFNQKLKLRFERVAKGENCVDMLNEIQKDQHFELIRAVNGRSEAVSYDYQRSYSRLTSYEKTEELRKMKLIGASIVSWDPPLGLLSRLSLKLMDERIRQATKYESAPHKNGSYIVSKGANLTLVQRESQFDSMTCSICKQELPESVCIHITCVLMDLDDHQRNTELIKMDEFCKNRSEYEILKRNKKPSAGKKPGNRKFDWKSKHNNTRKLERMSINSDLGFSSAHNTTTDSILDLVNNEEFDESDCEHDEETKTESSVLNNNLTEDEASDVVMRSVESRMSNASTKSQSSEGNQSPNQDDSSLLSLALSESQTLGRIQKRRRKLRNPLDELNRALEWSDEETVEGCNNSRTSKRNAQKRRRYSPSQF